MKTRVTGTASLLLLFSTMGFAQEITGRITDQSGAIVPKAQVMIHNVATGVDIATKTTSAGDYAVPYLKPGVFNVSVEMAGFEKEVRSQVELQTDQTATINFVLKIGAASETMTVKSDAALIDFSTAETGEVIDKTRVTEEPINGRNPIMLSVYSAGVTNTGANTAFIRPFDQPQENFAINGGQPGANELLIDGAGDGSSIGFAGNLTYEPPVDSVGEFKIITSPYDAAYGRSGGGVIDISLKSGTNQVHGDAYEFARRSWLDANTWQNDYYNGLNGTHNFPKHSLDQYGFELDGPVVVPKLYNGRDKSFLAMQWEHWHEIAPQTIITSVPDPSWLTGDFSNLTYLNGNVPKPVTIYDPLTGHTDPATGAFVRSPFPNNIIPPGRINPVAAKILSYYPKPNTQAAPNTNFYTNNYTNPSPIVDIYNNAFGKWDQNITSKDRFSLRYGYYARFENYPTNGLPAGNGAYQGLEPYGNREHQFATEEVHTFSPTLLFDFKASLGIVDNFYRYGPLFDETQLGFSAANVAQYASVSHYFPVTNLSGFATLGAYGPGGNVSHDLFLLPAVTWIKSTHSVHVGVDIRLEQEAANVAGGNPTLSVGNGWTQQNYASGDPASGNSIASMLLGTMDSGNVQIQDTNFWSQHYFAPFIQDDWKVTPRLTLNLGARWDFVPGPVERHNRAIYTFDDTVTNPVNSQVNTSLLPGGVVKGGITYLGANGAPRALYSLNLGDIQPRVGFAYAVSPKTVLRGGFGERFRDANPTNPGGNPLGFSSNTNYVGTLDGGKTPLVNSINNPFPSVIQPTGSSLGALTGLGQGIGSLATGGLDNSASYVGKGYKIYNVWNFSLGIEQQITANDSVEIGFAGSRTYNLDTFYNDNLSPASYTDTCDLQLGHAPDPCNDDYRPNPFQGVAAFQGTGDYTASTLSGATLQSPLPAFGGISHIVNSGSSWYNSLQVSYNRKFQYGLTAHGTYTWSKQMDQGGFVDQTHSIVRRAIDPNDRTNAVTLSVVYDLPIGRGRQLLGNTNRIVDAAIGGWELGNLNIFQTGLPWTPNANGYGYAYSGSAYLQRRKDPTTGYIRGVEPCGQEWVEASGKWALQQLPASITYGCNHSNFSLNPQYAINQNVVYSGIRDPGNIQWDANMMKNFAVVGERVKLQLRFEMFNVANHPIWQSAYSNNPFDPNFGTIERGPTGQSNLPRQTQIALKLLW